MHIAIIADPIDKQSAGIHYYTKNLISHLLEIDKKNNYSIIKLNNDPIREGIPSIALKNTFGFLHDDPYRTFVSLPRLIRKLNPDVVVESAHFGPFNFPKSIKRVTVVHDLTPIKFPHFHRFSSQFFQRLFLPGIIRRADLLITNSKNTSKDLFECFPKSMGKTEFIYLGKTDTFKPSFSTKVLEYYKIETPYFLTVSTIEPRKNLITLLEAYKEFRIKTGKKTKLVISGGIGWKSRTFFKNYFQHPFKSDIKLIGYVNRRNLPYLYTHTEAFIFPSLYEGFGLPVLEAMACGAPCIVSNVASLPEVCEEAAMYFNPYSASALSAKMEMISDFEGLKNDLSSKSVEQSKKFSWEKHAKEFIRIIEEKFN